MVSQLGGGHMISHLMGTTEHWEKGYRLGVELVIFWKMVGGDISYFSAHARVQRNY